ncbi:MAG: TatD family hydrolase [Chitinophagales bacterium]
MPLTDTHAHIYLPEFDSDRLLMIEHALRAGVGRIFLPNIDKDSIDSMLQLSMEQTDLCFPMMGLHPCSVKADYESQLNIIEHYFNEGKIKFYGVGECGLDYYWDKTFVNEQKTAFSFQIELAKKFRLPLSIHSREATGDCIELIAQHKTNDLRGVFHCFSGSADQLQQIIELGFYAGIGGVVTFKNGGLDKILQPQHLDHLVLETDSPYLAPAPFRGKRNEPAYLEYIINKLAEVLNMEIQTVAEALEKNAVEVFG